MKNVAKIAQRFKRQGSGLATIALWLLLFASDAHAQWSPIANMPVTKEQHGCAALNGFVYSMGGIGPSNTCYRYDIALNSWAAIASMPTAVAYPSACALNGRIYVTGGYAGCCGGTETAALQVYDPILNSWTTLAPMPAARAAHGSAALGGKLYVVGGSIGATTFATLFEYDPALNTWATRASMANNRYQLIAAAANGRLYAVGGFNTGVTNVNEEYNPATNTWVTRAPLALARYLHGGGSVEDNGQTKIVVAGGYSGGWLNNSALYNPVTNTWAANPNMSSIRGRVAGAGENNCFYMVAGYSGASSLSTAERLCFAIPLPVEFLSLEGNRVGDDVHLTWHVSEHEGLNTFIVERSSDGVTFQGIGEVQTEDAIMGTAYGFVDEDSHNLGSGIVFYRIQQADIDGKTAYSSVLPMHLEPQSIHMVISPNPATTTLNCHLFSPKKQSMQIQIIDLLGNVLVTRDASVSQEQEMHQIDISSLAAGIYVAKLSSGSNARQLKFIKE